MLVFIRSLIDKPVLRTWAQEAFKTWAVSLIQFTSVFPTRFTQVKLVISHPVSCGVKPFQSQQTFLVLSKSGSERRDCLHTRVGEKENHVHYWTLKKYEHYVDKWHRQLLMLWV